MLVTSAFTLVALAATCARPRAEHKQVASPIVASSVSSSAAQPAASASAQPPAIEPLVGPVRLLCSETSDCLESELTLYGDSSSRAIESVWVKVKLRPSDRAARLGLEPMLVPVPFPAATRLLEVQSLENSVSLSIESARACARS
jgi:hypothetical protein